MRPKEQKIRCLCEEKNRAKKCLLRMGLCASLTESKKFQPGVRLEDDHPSLHRVPMIHFYTGKSFTPV